jgi:hypothetical protein
MSLTAHALARAAERHGVHLDPADQRRILDAAVALANDADDDVAAVLHRLPQQVGVPWSDRSNGDLVVAIIRGGQVRTLMFRRGTQPLTPEALRVDRVLVAA